MEQARRQAEENKIVSGVNIFVQWRTAVVQENGDAYFFPDKFTRYFRERYAIPALYRWRTLKCQPDDKEMIYIGEAEDLARRIQRVRTPSSTAKDCDTNKRLNQLFLSCIAENRKIVLDVADIEPFEINGIRFDRRNLGDRFKRRALENLILVFAQASNESELLNVFVDPLDNAREALSKLLKPHQVREVLKHYGLDKAT